MVQLSDVHVGPLVADEFVLDVFARVRALKPDLIVITGDFASALTENTSHCARVYSQVPLGRLGTFGVLGNHDYGHAWSNERAADRLVDTLRSSGVQILRNEAADVSGLQVVGFDDLWARHFNPAEAMKGVDSARPMLGLSHNPDSVDVDDWSGFRGYVLCGHTHGGQCRLPFLTPPVLPVENKRYTSGLFDLTGERTMYINRGIGHLTQARFFARPEITVFTLSAAEQASAPA